jgi:spoIIIJ-associated protein
VSEQRWIRDGALDRDAAVPALRSFLGLLVRSGRFELRAEITPPPADAPHLEKTELVVNFDGPDSELLLARQGELLRAIEHVAVRWLGLGPEDYDRVRFDCQGYRAGREAELALAARTAAERVKQSRAPYRFSPMSARERRLIHLALRDDPAVRTASEGEGPARAVVVYPT